MSASLFSYITPAEACWSLAACVAAFYLMERIRFRLSYDWHKIPSTASWPIVGDVLHLYRFSGAYPRVHEYTYHWWKKLGKPKMLRRQNGPVRFLVVCDPEYVQHELTTHRGVQRQGLFKAEKYFGPDQAKSIILRKSHDPKWKAVRRNVAQAFSTANLRKTFPEARKVANKLLAELDKSPSGKPLEISKLLTYFTFEVISSWGMGVETNAIETRSNPLFDAQMATTEESFRDNTNVLRAYLKTWLPFLPMARRAQAKLNQLYKAIDELYDRMDVDTSPAEDDYTIAACLKRGRNADEEHRLTDAEFKAEAVTFFSAGTDTTAVQLTWTLCCLACHPQVQERLADELAGAGLGGGDPRDLVYDDLSKLPYLNAVIKEGMRLVPAAPLGAPRLLLEDRMVLGHRIPKGTYLTSINFLLNRHDKYCEDPDVFNPDRWLGNELPTQQHDPESGDRNIWTFGNGPRSCVGQRLAILELQIMIAMMMGRYRVELAECMGGWEGALARKYDKILINCEGGMWMKLFPREHVVEKGREE